ncbi:MAG TPA: PH domain-containing protein [Allosphingosinicella sp.]|nr:PH domain-containing protein [Allosphingosinicella sp.]
MTLDGVADRRLHPATFLIRAVRTLPQYALGLPALVSTLSDARSQGIFLALLGGIALALASGFLVWWRFRYGVGPAEVVIESGVLHRQRRVIPIDRIQDIDIEQGLLARLFGTAKVRIETGGSAKDEGNLDSVSLEDAHRLRELLRRRRAADGASVPAEEEKEPVIFSMDVKRVLLAGLFNFSLVFLAVLFGSLEYVETLFGFDPLKMEWVAPLRGLAASVTWGLTALAILFVLLIGIVAGILRTLARDFGFRLTRTAGGLRRRRGLFTLSEVVIPFRRVQLALIRSGPVARHFGWHRLEFQTLSADAAKGGHQVAAPFARMEEVLQVLGEVHAPPLPREEEYVRVSKRHILRQSLRWALQLAVPVAVTAVIWPPALAFLLLLPLLAGGAALQWKHHRYCLTPNALHVRHGLLSRRLWIVPYERIQALAVDQGPLQRRLGLASLAIDTAGASLFRAPVIVNLPAGEADRLAARLLADHKSARERLRMLRDRR